MTAHMLGVVDSILSHHDEAKGHLVAVRRQLEEIATDFLILVNEKAAPTEEDANDFRTRVVDALICLRQAERQLDDVADRFRLGGDVVESFGRVVVHVKESREVTP